MSGLDRPCQAQEVASRLGPRGCREVGDARRGAGSVGQRAAPLRLPACRRDRIADLRRGEAKAAGQGVEASAGPAAMPAGAIAAAHCARRPANPATANATVTAPAAPRHGARVQARIVTTLPAVAAASRARALAEPLVALEHLDAVEIEHGTVEQRLPEQAGDSAIPRLGAGQRLAEIDGEEWRRQRLGQRFGGAPAAGAGGAVEMQQQRPPCRPRRQRQGGERTGHGRIARCGRPALRRDQNAERRQRRIEPTLPEQPAQDLAVEAQLVGE